MSDTPISDMFNLTDKRLRELENQVEAHKAQIAILIDRQAKFESKCREFEKQRFQPAIDRLDGVVEILARNKDKLSLMCPCKDCRTRRGESL